MKIRFSPTLDLRNFTQTQFVANLLLYIAFVVVLKFIVSL